MVPSAVPHRVLRRGASNESAAANGFRRQRGRRLHPRLDRVAARRHEGADDPEQVDDRHAEVREGKSAGGEPALHPEAYAWVGVRHSDAQYVVIMNTRLKILIFRVGCLHLQVFFVIFGSEGRSGECSLHILLS